MPKTTKDAVDEVILKAVERNPANGNLGCPQRFSQTLQASKRSRERSSSSSSTEMQVIQLVRIYRVGRKDIRISKKSHV